MIVHVDQLRIRFPGATDIDGHDLARLVAERLAEARPTLLARAELPRLNVSLAAGASADTIADAIVTQLLAALARAA